MHGWTEIVFGWTMDARCSNLHRNFWAVFTPDIFPGLIWLVEVQNDLPYISVNLHMNSNDKKGQDPVGAQPIIFSENQHDFFNRIWSLD